MPVNRFNPTSWVAAFTPTDRPKSIRNRCVIEVFGGIFVLSRWVLIFLCVCVCVCGAFCHSTESDLFLLLFYTDFQTENFP